MSIFLKFIRKNHILALIEQALNKKNATLNLSAFEMSDIPEILFTCREVENLYLHRNNLILIPIELTQLRNLTTLTLDYNNIEVLPAEIGTLKNLVNLNISYNPLNRLAPEICELENLEALWCNRIGLKEIPREVSKLEKLDTFGARGNELTTIPEELCLLVKLRWLTLENNAISHLPKVNGLSAIMHLNLRHNCLKELPDIVVHCEELMYLHLSHNEIMCLPAEFDPSHMGSIQMIDLRNNPICDAPHTEHPLLRYSDVPPSGGTHEGALNARTLNVASLVLNAIPLRPQAPPPHHNLPEEEPIIEVEMESESFGSSEDWDNSVNSSELDVHYLSDVRMDNDAVGMVLPELSRFASTAS